MKGLKVIRATGQNAIDIYPLLKKAAKEGVLFGSPTDRQLKDFYFGTLFRQLGINAQFNYWYLARRGRGYLGVLHAAVIPGLWDGTADSMMVSLIYVVDNRRKQGIGRKLIEALKKDAESINIHKLQFLSPDDQVGHWTKELGAKKISNLMRVDL